jgi:hypothetical protein
MPPLRVVASLALIATVLAPAPAPARAAPSAADPRDGLLLERAIRVGRNVAARHTTPEGILAYQHRHAASPEDLSSDALTLADAAIWTGCYAASLACRYAVTRDPEALVEARRIAGGLDLLSAATGVPGALSRTVGRLRPGEPVPKAVRASPLGGGLLFRDDPSRDSLAGVVLGWACLRRFVDDPEVSEKAVRNLVAIARRLRASGMKVKDSRGKTTEHGDLDPSELLGLVDNAEYAAIGLGTVAAGAAADPAIRGAYDRLTKDGWASAVDSTYTWLRTPLLDASNLNLVHLALATLALDGYGKGRANAKHALRDLRRRTKGWMNGGCLACYLLAGEGEGRGGVIDELRETLASMPASEVEVVSTRRLPSRGPVPPGRRPIADWMWKTSSFVEEHGRETGTPRTDRTFTRADFLFAYWLARAAGALGPAPAGPR